MPTITLRSHPDETRDTDLSLTIKDNTFEYLMAGTAEEVRVSAYLEVPLKWVEKKYIELILSQDCPFRYFVKKIIPGSKTRKVTLPGEMFVGEQLTILVNRK